LACGEGPKKGTDEIYQVNQAKPCYKGLSGGQKDKKHLENFLKTRG